MLPFACITSNLHHLNLLAALRCLCRCTISLPRAAIQLYSPSTLDRHACLLLIGMCFPSCSDASATAPALFAFAAVVYAHFS